MSGLEIVELVISIIQFMLSIIAAGYVYVRFFHEQPLSPRTQLELDMVDLGLVENGRMIEIGCLAENKGFVEHTIFQIHLRVRGMTDGPADPFRGREPRLAFPDKLAEMKLAKENESFFVRPGVRQRFPAVILVPTSCTHIIAKATFSYREGSKIHNAERAWRLASPTA